MQLTYTYQRKDGGTTECYGEITPESNFEIACDNEADDSIFTSESFKDWPSACEYLEKFYDRKIEQVTAC